MGVRGNIKVTPVQRVSEYDRWDWLGPGFWVAFLTWAAKHPPAGCWKWDGETEQQVETFRMRTKYEKAELNYFCSLHWFSSGPLTFPIDVLYVKRWPWKVCTVLTSLQKNNWACWMWRQIKHACFRKSQEGCPRQEVDVAFHVLCVLSACSWSSMGHWPSRSDNASEAHLFTLGLDCLFWVSGKSHVKKGR